jgi:hypothetical protein
VPGAVPDDFGETVANRRDALRLKKIEMSPPERVEVTVEATDRDPEETFGAVPDHLVFGEDGTEVGTVLDLVQGQLPCVDVTEVMRDATGEEQYFEVGVDLLALRTDSGDDVSLFVRKEDVEPPVLRRMGAIRIVGPAHVGVAKVPLTYRELQKTVYGYGESEIRGDRVVLVITDETPTQKRTSYRVTKKPTRKRRPTSTRGKRKQ